LTITHITQISEDWIIFSSKKLITLADAYSTGSSLMPQKKNPDALELLRGKSGRVFGSLIGLLTLLKGLPRAYNKDLQEDKELLFDTIRTLKGSLPIMTGVISSVTVSAPAMRNQLVGEMLATDLAEYLVRKGVPFRETHHVAGAAVKLAEERGITLTDLKYEDLKPLHSAFEEDVILVWDFEKSVENRNTEGGTARKSVIEQIRQMREWLKANPALEGSKPIHK
jgi:argininosuccinate lyase